MQEVCTRSRVKKLTGKFNHQIVGWAGVPKNVGDHIESSHVYPNRYFHSIITISKVELCGHRWQLRIFPGGSSVKHKNHISIYLANRSPCSVQASYVIIAIHDSGENVIFRSAGVKTFEIQGQGKIDGWGRDRFISNSMLASEADGFLINDTVSFSVEITVFGDIEQEGNEVDTGYTIDQDIRNLFFRSDVTDFSIVIKDSLEEFKCHRCILEARCPVFRAMFSHDMLENSNKQVVLEEEGCVVRAFLEFLYSDYCSEECLSEMGVHLLSMAVKYQMPLLMSICESHLCKSVTANNVLGFFLFSDRHNTFKLRNCCVEFMQMHPSDILTHHDLSHICSADRALVESVIAPFLYGEAGSSISEKILCGIRKNEITQSSCQTDAIGQKSNSSRSSANFCNIM